MLNFIVTGTGRCGTVFMAKLLTSLGVPCGHESFFNLDTKFPLKLDNIKPVLSYVSEYDQYRNIKTPNWIDPKLLVADCSYMAAPFLNEPEVSLIPLIHLVRNPLHVLSSMMSNGYFSTPPAASAFATFMNSHTPGLFIPKSRIGRCCAFWIKWNEFIIHQKNKSPREYLLHRVEDGASDQLIEFLDIQKKPKRIFNNRKCNKWKDNEYDININDIPVGFRNKIQELCDLFGYNFGPKIL